MGNNKSNNNLKISNDLSEECKKAYFKQVKKDFSEGIKKINLIIHSSQLNVSFSADNWITYLLEKFNEYLNTNILNNRCIQQILYYLNNTEEVNEFKYVHNLSIYLSQEIEELSTNSERQKEDFKKGEINLTKDEILWRGSEFIFKDIEDINHPINGFIRNLTFILADAYEKEYLKIIENLEKNISPELTSCHTNEEKESKDNIYLFSDNEEIEESTNKYTLPSSNSSENKHINNFYRAIHKEIATFSSFIANALVRFYSIKNSTSPKLFVIFCEKIKDCIIRKDLYCLIYKMKSKIHARKKEKYSESLVEYYNIKPHYLCTSPYYSLDRNFRKLVKGYMNNKSILSNNNSDKKLSKLAFDKSILLLRQIRDNDSIMKKIDIMFKLRSSILNEIDEFWKDIPLKHKYKSVDADNLLSVFIYLMIKSQLDSLIIDLEIIDDYASRSLKLSRKGYFFSLFQSSIDYLIGNLSLSQMDYNIIEYNNMLLKEISVLNSTPELILKLD